MVVLWSGSSYAATRIAAIVRGVGAGSDKAAAFVAHFVPMALAEGDRYEVVDLSEQLGGAREARIKRAFEVAEEMEQKGRAAYESLDLDAAIDSLNTALAKYERHAGHVDKIEKMASVLMLLGATHILRGEEKTGAKRLAQAIAIQPNVEPDPRIFNPGMRQIFEQTAEELSRRPPGSLSLTSNPGYARVFVDGRFVGVTPATLDKITEGRHFVRMVKDGYLDWGKVVEVVGGHEASEAASLKQSDGYDEFDNLVEAALPSLPNKKTGDTVGASFKQLGVLLDADLVLMAEVRLDGERVRVMAAQVDVGKTKVLLSGTQVFSYDSRPETYEREVSDLIQSHFADKSVAKNTDKEDEPGPGGLATVGGPGACRGMPCAKFKKLALTLGAGGGGGMVLLGGLLDYLARLDNQKYKETPQTSSQATDLHRSGTLKAVLGDVFLTLGLAAAGTGIYLAFFWTPAAEPTQVLSGKSPSASFMVLPLDHGAALSVGLTF